MRHRRSSRILLFDRRHRFLLFLTTAPDTSGVARWITPGGGVDPGETHEQGGIRELFEETGLVVEGLGYPVWTSDFTVDWDDADHDTGHAEFFVHQTDAFEPSDAHWTPEERVDVLASHWWSLEELEHAAELFEPEALPAVVGRILPSLTHDLPSLTQHELPRQHDIFEQHDLLDPHDKDHR